MLKGLWITDEMNQPVHSLYRGRYINLIGPKNSMIDVYSWLNACEYIIFLKLYYNAVFWILYQYFLAWTCLPLAFENRPCYRRGVHLGAVEELVPAPTYLFRLHVITVWTLYYGIIIISVHRYYFSKKRIVYYVLNLLFNNYVIIEWTELQFEL